ncbi:MAG: ribosome biogenesis GTP-binding protein YihA/YsxC [Oscillospiraceae bacterium]|jgi:GTP-binding protein|nr:ribosome biogenesis GTP-binding protein YihA/YsxC [Oscillospiraceae bacterium]
MKSEPASFICSAYSPEDFIIGGKPVVAFAGRSNAGKSSVINTLTGRRSLAHVGKAPGKTQSVNYYAIGSKLCFADLPGYGYAKVGKATIDAWSVLMEAFFARPDTVAFGILVVDSRHTPTSQDALMARYFAQSAKPWAVVANKADKLKKSDIPAAAAALRGALGAGADVPVTAFSCVNGLGKDEILQCIYRNVAR